jgi:hypothetical protein
MHTYTHTHTHTVTHSHTHTHTYTHRHLHPALPVLELPLVPTHLPIERFLRQPEGQNTLLSLYNMYYTLHTTHLHYTLYTIHFTIHYKLHTKYCTLYTLLSLPFTLSVAESSPTFFPPLTCARTHTGTHRFLRPRRLASCRGGFPRLWWACARPESLKASLWTTSSWSPTWSARYCYRPEPQ